MKYYEYVHKSDFPERKFFRKGKWRAGTHHLHVYAMSGPQWRNNILFRDYLRNHADTLLQYYRLGDLLKGIDIKYLDLRRTIRYVLHF